MVMENVLVFQVGEVFLTMADGVPRMWGVDPAGVVRLLPPGPPGGGDWDGMLAAMPAAIALADAVLATVQPSGIVVLDPMLVAAYRSEKAGQADAG